MRNKAFTHTLSEEKIKEFAHSTPEQRLKWLQDAQEFVKNVVPSEKLEHWRKLQGKKDTY